MKNTVLTIITLATLVLSGCTTSTGGSIIQEGSSTVEPLAHAWAEAWGIPNGVDIQVKGGGSGHGATALCAGTLDIGDMSRAIKDSEVQKCADNGIDSTVWKVALDALTVVVSKENDFLHDVTVEDLREIFRGPYAAGGDQGSASDSKLAPYRGNGATKWSDIDPSYPDEPITLCFPDSASGTYGYFQEEILEVKDDNGDKHMLPYKRAANTAGNGKVFQSAVDQEIVTCMGDDENAIGFFGYSFFDNNRDRLRGLRVDGVQPSIVNVVSGTYQPLGRYLYMVTDGVPTTGTVLHQYFEYALTDGQDSTLMTTAGFIPLDSATLGEMKAQLGI